jgi:hypothetical protein
MPNMHEILKSTPSHKTRQAIFAIFVAFSYYIPLSCQRKARHVNVEAKACSIIVTAIVGHAMKETIDVENLEK